MPEPLSAVTVASSLELVVHVGTDPDGRRRVREIVAVPGRDGPGVIAAWSHSRRWMRVRAGPTAPSEIVAEPGSFT